MKHTILIGLIVATVLLRYVDGRRLGRDVRRADGERLGFDVPPVIGNIGRARFIGNGRIFWNPADPPPFVTNLKIDYGW
jgi:hypothetical protein